jgi:flagellar FliL protein
MASTDQASPEALRTASQSHSPLLLIILVLALLNTSASGWLVYTLRSGTMHQEAAAASIEVPPVDEPPAAVPEETALAALDPFIANLADPSGKRYLRAVFEIEVSPPVVVEEMHKKTSQLRDGILVIFTNKSYEEIRTTAGKGVLREEIVTEVNKIVTGGKARQIFFKEFIVQ